MWGEMYPGISQICGRGLGSSPRSRPGRSSHVAALWERVAPLLPNHAGLATVVGTPHLERGSSVSELWEEAAGRTRQWVVWCLVPCSWVVVRAPRAPWGGQGQKEDGCWGQSPYRACTCSLELIIRRVHRALPFTRSIPSQVWVLWSPLALFLSGIGEGRGRCLFAVSRHKSFFRGSRNSFTIFILCAVWVFLLENGFLLYFSMGNVNKASQNKLVLCVCVCLCMCAWAGLWMGWKKIHHWLGGLLMATALPAIASFNSQDNPEDSKDP